MQQPERIGPHNIYQAQPKKNPTFMSMPSFVNYSIATIFTGHGPLHAQRGYRPSKP